MSGAGFILAINVFVAGLFALAFLLVGISNRTDLLPQLRTVCPGDELRELSEKFHRAKKMAPTRPHPSAPDRPPANKILGPGAGLVDRLRDALTGRN